MMRNNFPPVLHTYTYMYVHVRAQEETHPSVYIVCPQCKQGVCQVQEVPIRSWPALACMSSDSPVQLGPLQHQYTFVQARTALHAAK